SPRTRGARHFGLSAELSFDTYFAGDGGHLVGEGTKRVGHGVNGFGQGGDFAFGFENEFLREVAVGDGGHNLDDTAHLLRQVTGHEIHVIGEILPRTGHTFHIRLTAELSFGAYFFGNAGNFGGERVQLIDERVDRVLQLEDL